MKGLEATEIVSDLASQQWGLVTSTQAKNNGVDLPSLRRLEKRGALVRIRHGVYASAATTWSAELEVKAQWLALRPELMAADRASDLSLAVEAVVSHTTAAEIWGIGDLWPDGIHFTVSERRRSRQPDVRFHRDDLTGSDWTIHPEVGLPVTTVSRTILDLAESGHEPGHLLGLVADAGRKSLLDEQDLLDALAGHEDVLGVDRGDRRGLKNLLEGYFPEDKIVRQARSAVDEALRPVQEQMKTMLDSLMPKVTWPESMVNPLSQYGDSFTSPMQSVMQTASANMFPGITETIRKVTGIGTMKDSVWDSIYPAGVLPPSTLTGRPQLRSARPRRYREDEDTGDGSPEDEEDTRSDHHGAQDGGEETGQEPQ